VEGKITGTLDNRLIFYMTNQKKIPSISGRIIPENSESREKYERRVLHRMYRDIAPFDPEGILRHEWLNSRGAVPRFARSAIELRLLDVQECPLADISVAAVVAAVVRAESGHQRTCLSQGIRGEGTKDQGLRIVGISGRGSTSFRSRRS
jgi:carboxylate-amine ligase